MSRGWQGATWTGVVRESARNSSEEESRTGEAGPSPLREPRQDAAAESRSLELGISGSGDSQQLVEEDRGVQEAGGSGSGRLCEISSRAVQDFGGSGGSGTASSSQIPAQIPGSSGAGPNDFRQISSYGWGPPAPGSAGANAGASRLSAPCLQEEAEARGPTQMSKAAGSWQQASSAETSRDDQDRGASESDVPDVQPYRFNRYELHVLRSCIESTQTAGLALAMQAFATGLLGTALPSAFLLSSCT